MNIKDYIISKKYEIDSLYNINISNDLVDKFISYYDDKELNDVKNEIDIRIDNYVKSIIKNKKVHEMEELIPVKDNKEGLFGCVYKSYVIDIFRIYESVINDINITDKVSEYNKLFNKYISNSKYIENSVSKMGYTSESAKSDLRFNKYVKSYNDSIKSLSDFNTVGNLYNMFINEYNIIVNDSKDILTLSSKESLFDNNHDINPNASFDFSELNNIFSFARDHNKKIKLHTFLFHNDVPALLKSEVDKVSDPSTKRKMVLEFLDLYASKLEEFCFNNNFDLAQVTALNEIANNSLDNDNILRDSFWSESIGNDYYIEVLKILKKHFPNTTLIYNEYNEFIPYKKDRMCKIIDSIKAYEEKYGINLLDGIGLESHYEDYIQDKTGVRKFEKEDLLSLIMSISKYSDKKVYVTEYDYINHDRNNTNEFSQEYILSMLSKISDGIMFWNPSDKITWYHCYDANLEPYDATLVNSDGTKKALFNKVKDIYVKKMKI